MGIYSDYTGFFEDDVKHKKQERDPQIIEPKTISQLIIEHKLLYPFVIKKVSTGTETYFSVLFPVGTVVTITKKLPTLFGYYADKNDVYFEGFADQFGYEILDTASWMLVEKSGNNVIPLSGYKKFRENRAIKTKKR